MIQYCNTCLLPATKPDLKFSANGKCSACTAYENRPSVDWSQREKEFIEITNKFKDNNDSNWDCIVPVSGGKDSTAQVLKVLEFGLRPLCVTSTTCDLSTLGRMNLDNIKKLGVDLIEVSPDKKIRRLMNRFALETIGDISWPEHVGIFTIPVKLAVAFRIPLLIWGENSQNEYGGPAAAQESSVLNRAWLEEFGGLLGLRVGDLPLLLDEDNRSFGLYEYPEDTALASVGVTGLFLGHYFQWDGLSNYIVSQAHGFQDYGKNVEGSSVSYENLDNYHTGIHDYFKYLKFGFGRATDITSLQIRRGRMTRLEALEIVRKFDGRFPHEYLGKPLGSILNDLGLTREEFDFICDRFTNKELFSRSANGEISRDIDGTPLKINYDN